jgi:hypothetical protein
LDYYSRHYDESKVGLYRNWNKDKSRLLKMMKTYLPETLAYAQGSRRRALSLEEVCYVYYPIEQMEWVEQNSILENSLSYNQVDDYFISEFGKKCGKHKFSGILKLLIANELIKKVGNYKVGLRGNCYQVTNK